MPKLIRLAITGYLFFIYSVFVAYAGSISPETQRVLQSLAPHEELSVIITLSDKADIHLIKEINRSFLRSKIIKALKGKADLTQRPLKIFLQNRRAKRITPLWIINGIAATLRAEAVRELESQPGIEQIRLDEIIQAPLVTYGTSAVPEWNISAIQAPELWNLGFTGQGVVVASMDTGVDYLHPDLASKWRGGTNSWYDPNGQHATPHDASGHGTQTMGIMVGGSAGGTAIGVAPDAKWIAVKIFNDAGVSSSSITHQGFQWLLDPDGNPDTDDAPDVVNNSWGLIDHVNECVLEFQNDIQTLKTAGVAVVFSGGSSGPSPSTSLSPANNPEGFAVGSVNQSFNIALDSSRGPSACGGSTYPTTVAPGVNIRTTDLTFGGVFPNSYAIVSGTSFSAPHVAGTMALLRGALPDLTASEMESVLRQSALDLGTSGPDNDYGYGLVDAFEAYLEAHQLLFGQDIYDIVVRYYRDILGRDPEPAGFEWWMGEVERMITLGVDVKEVLITIAKIFFNAPEYTQLAKTETDYIIDLYETYLNRTPAQWEVSFWTSYMAGGASWNLVRNWFAYSEEFRLHMEDMFGKVTTRPENDLVNDYYRSFLNRLPDTDGLNFWLSFIREAQCVAPQEIGDLSFQIALAFSESLEYVLRNRDHYGYVEDLYEGILHRSADPVNEIGYWTDLLNSGLLSREQMLGFFADSTEFQLRIEEIIDAGCLP